MVKYRKKPVEIEAIQFTRETWKEVLSFTGNTAHSLVTPRCINGKSTCIIPTLEGHHIATEGDYIIKGVQGEHYPCKPDIFAQTYDLVYEKPLNVIKETFETTLKNAKSSASADTTDTGLQPLC